MAKYIWNDLIEKSTGDKVRKLLSEDELVELLEDGVYALPESGVFGTAPGLISGYNMKPPEAFRGMLRQMKKGNPNSNINTW